MGRRGELKGPKGAWDPTEGSLLGGAQRSYGFRGPNPRCGQESPLAAIRLRLRVTSESPPVSVTLAVGRLSRLASPHDRKRAECMLRGENIEKIRFFQIRFKNVEVFSF